MTKKQIEELIFTFNINNTLANLEEVAFLEEHNPELLDAMQALMRFYYEAEDEE